MRRASVIVVLTVTVAGWPVTPFAGHAFCCGVAGPSGDSYVDETPRNVLDGRDRGYRWVRRLPTTHGKPGPWRRVAEIDLLDLGATYEVSHYGPADCDRCGNTITIDKETDRTPPAFMGVSGVRMAVHPMLRGYLFDGLGREIVIEHELPPDTASIEIAFRRPGERDPFWRRQQRPRFRARTVLAGIMCNDNDAPKLDPERLYCVSVSAIDAAGNAFGGAVERCAKVKVCAPLMSLIDEDCRFLTEDLRPPPAHEVPGADIVPLEPPPVRWRGRAGVASMIALVAVIGLMLLRPRRRAWR